MLQRRNRRPAPPAARTLGLGAGLALSATLAAQGQRALAAAASTNSSPSGGLRLLADLPLLQLLIYGSLIGLGLAVAGLLLIWWHEWRHGQNW